MNKQPIHLGFYFIILAGCWTLLIFSMMIYDQRSTQGNILKLARLQAVTGLEKDIIYRRWNAQNGGLFGQISKKNLPNQYLQVEDRDIETPTGSRKLTLINPAYMTRQVHELERENNGLMGHITSLNPIRPENSADECETLALRQFENGVQEFSSLQLINNRNYLRVMRPLMVDQACMSCHAIQGYTVGQIRGGLSISVPMEPWFDHRDKVLRQHRLFLASLWLMVLIGLGAGFISLQRKIRLNLRIQSDLNNMKTIFDRINDIVLLVYPDTLQFFYVNQAAAVSTGYSEESLLQMKLPDFFADFDLQTFERRYAELKTANISTCQYESIVENKNGNKKPVEVQLQYLVLDQQVEYLAAVVRDISSRRHYEQKQQKLLLRLQQSQKLESVGQLASGIAHEINTPTQYIGTNLEFLKEGFAEVKELISGYSRFVGSGICADSGLLEDIEKIRETTDWEYLEQEIPQAIQQSQDGIQQISSIVLAMKDFSHPGSREKEPADINRIIQMTVTVARNEWKNIAELHLDLADDMPVIPCRPNEIRQVILNVLINAVHAIDDHRQQNSSHGPGTISITTRILGGVVQITLTDNGGGIPETIRHKIFDPFFTTKRVGRGSGQGLAIAHDIIINKHQGKLDVAVEEGVGTTFIIQLPLRLEDQLATLEKERENA